MRLLLLGMLFVSATSALANGEGDQTTFEGVSGYAAGQGCSGGQEGGDESASGVRPSLHTVENPGDGWAMAAVALPLYKKIKGCEGMVNGVKVKVMDTCPACVKNGKIDINHSKCSQMNDSNYFHKITVSWSNCRMNVRGRHGEVRTDN